jgi:tetratricopeptide (TPR) repeat protein
MSNLASTYLVVGKVQLALPLIEDAYKRSQALRGLEHPDTLASMINLAECYQAAGKIDQALPLFEEAAKLCKNVLGPDHPQTLSAMNYLGMNYAPTRLDLALPILEDTLQRRKAKLGPDHPDTLVSLNNLALAYWATGKLDRSLPLFEEAAAGIEKRRFQGETATKIIHNLIRCCEQHKEYKRAEGWRRKWLGVLKSRSDADPDNYAAELASLGLNLLNQHKWNEAEAVLRECLTMREKTEPDDWRTFNARSMLGEALAGQNKYVEAKPLLVKGFEGLRLREANMPREGQSRLHMAADRLVRLYEAMDKPDEAAKWRKESESLKPAAKP